MLTHEQEIKLLKEVSFHTSRSGGKGGQNVNKVETKVEIEFDVQRSEVLHQDQKEIILKKYPDLVGGSLIKLTSGKHRTQLRNKSESQKKLIALLHRLLKVSKKRRYTAPTKSSIQKKLKDKKFHSEKKSLRQKIR